MRTIHPEVVGQLLAGEDPFRACGRLLVLMDGDRWNRRLARWNAWHAGGVMREEVGAQTSDIWVEGGDGSVVERDAFDLAMRQTEVDWASWVGFRSKPYALEQFKERVEQEYVRALAMRKRGEFGAARGFALAVEGAVEELGHLEMEHAIAVLSRHVQVGASYLLWALGLVQHHHGVSDLLVSLSVVRQMGLDLEVEFQAEVGINWLAAHSVGGHLMARRWMRRVLSSSGLGGVVVDITEPLWNVGPAVVQRFRAVVVDEQELEAARERTVRAEGVMARGGEGLALAMAEVVAQVDGLLDPELLGERGRLEVMQNAKEASDLRGAFIEVVNELVDGRCGVEVWHQLWAAHVLEHLHPLYGVEGLASRPAELLFQPVLAPLVATQVAEVVLRWRHELVAAKGEVLPEGLVRELRSLEWVLVAKWNGTLVEWEQQEQELREVWDGMGALPELVWPGRRGRVCLDWRVLELLRPVAYCAMESLMKASGFLAEDLALASVRPGWLGDLWDPHQGGLTFRTVLSGAMQASARIGDVSSDDTRRRFESIWAMACGVSVEDVQAWMAGQTFELSDLVLYARYLAGRPDLANRYGGLGETLYALDHFKPAWIVGPLSRVA